MISRDSPVTTDELHAMWMACFRRIGGKPSRTGSHSPGRPAQVTAGARRPSNPRALNGAVAASLPPTASSRSGSCARRALRAAAVAAALAGAGRRTAGWMGARRVAATPSAFELFTPRP